MFEFLNQSIENFIFYIKESGWFFRGTCHPIVKSWVWHKVLLINYKKTVCKSG